MKKIIISTLALPLIAISLTFYGQAEFAGQKFSNSISADESRNLKDAFGLRKNEIKSKALRGFMKAYKNVTDEKWYKTSGGFVATFTRDEIIYHLEYDKRGNWLYTIRAYGENKLPDNIRHIVKSTYYDYDIGLVQETESPGIFSGHYGNILSYVIHLEGKTNWINLLVDDEVMEELQKI